jgi:hypothetical protein
MLHRNRVEDKQVERPAEPPDLTPLERMELADLAFQEAVRACWQLEFGETEADRAARARQDYGGRLEQMRAAIERARETATAAHVRYYETATPAATAPPLNGATWLADAEQRQLARLRQQLAVLGVLTKETLP